MMDRKLLTLLGREKRYIFYTVAAQLVGLLASVGTTACICRVFGLLLLGAGAPAFPPVFLAALACLGVRYASTRITGELRDLLGRNVKKELRERVYQKLLSLGLRSAQEMSMAGLTQISVEGIEQLDLYFSSYLPQFFFSMLAPLVLFGICAPIYWPAALVLLGCVPLIPLSIVAVSRYAKKIFAKYWGKYTSMGDKFLDSVQGMKELKIFRADQAQHQKMNESAEEFRRITMKVLVMQLMSTTIMDLVAYGGAGLGIAVAVAGLARGSLPPAQALFLVLVAVDFFLPLRAFGSAFHVAMNGVSAGQKILALLDAPDPVWGKEIPKGCEISLQNVSFSYDGKRDVVKDLSMTFPEKGMTAVVGESGCGKSTIVSLILGAQRPGQGSVTMGGLPIETLRRDDYYSRLAVVSCGTWVFNQTVRENFRLYKPDVTDQEINAALKLVKLEELIRENGGPDQMIQEDAANLSGGQKQRLVLAAALAADKDVYIFDEATSNIDIESEAVIMENIRALSRSKSVVVISHRLDNIVPADKIYYMEQGQVKESGTHAELMAQGGGYAKLYTLQKALEKGGAV